MPGAVVLDRLRSGLETFAFEPALPRPLAVLRIGVAATLIGEAATVAPHLHEYYGPLGVVQPPVAEALVHQSLPSLSALADALPFAGWTASGILLVAFAAYLIALHLLLLGYQTRIAAVLSWLLFLALKKSGGASAYGAFEFAQIGLFYCAVFPVGGALSLDALRHPAPPTAGARLALRLLQLHLCVVYLSSGIEKALGDQWWSGEAIWRALMRPGHVALDFSWLAYHPLVARIACWGTLAVEIGYAFLVWPRRTRSFWIMAAIGLHLAIAIALGLIFFSAIMIALNVAAFLIPAGPVQTLTRSAAGPGAGRIAGLDAGCPKAVPP